MATKKQLLAEAEKLGIEGLTEKTKNVDIEKAIAEARKTAKTMRYGGEDLVACHRCGRYAPHVHNER